MRTTKNLASLIRNKARIGVSRHTGSGTASVSLWPSHATIFVQPEHLDEDKYSDAEVRTLLSRKLAQRKDWLYNVVHLTAFLLVCAGLLGVILAVIFDARSEALNGIGLLLVGILLMPILSPFLENRGEWLRKNFRQ